eukprot:6146545-Pyramimonas_sp.AAC.1
MRTGMRRGGWGKREEDSFWFLVSGAAHLALGESPRGRSPAGAPAEGDPKKTKAKIVKINVKKKGIMQGVIVREGEDGVYPITRSLVIDVTKEYTLDDGSAVLDEAQLDDVMDIGSEAEEVAAAVEDSSFPAVPSSGVQTLDQAFKNKAKAEKGDDEDAGPSEKSSEKGSGGTSGSSSSDQSQSESENEGDGKDGDDGNDVLKRRRLSAKSEAKST